MMHISPCGWYSFELHLPSTWTLVDTAQETVITSPDKNCTIELQSARKTTGAIDDEVSMAHEDYLDLNNISRQKTVLSENPFKMKYYMSQGLGQDEMVWIVCHAFWNNYCLFVQFHSAPNREMEHWIETFNQLIQSIQPLVTN